MEPWYRVVSPRNEVREGRSFNPDEFAIALEQVVAGRGPTDYTDPVEFFSRTYFSRALREHAARHRGARPALRGGWRPGPNPVRRGAQLLQSPPRPGRAVPRLHPQPDRRHDRHDPQRGPN